MYLIIRYQIRTYHSRKTRFYIRSSGNKAFQNNVITITILHVVGLKGLNSGLVTYVSLSPAPLVAYRGGGVEGQRGLTHNGQIRPRFRSKLELNSDRAATNHKTVMHHMLIACANMPVTVRYIDIRGNAGENYQGDDCSAC